MMVKREALTINQQAHHDSSALSSDNVKYLNPFKASFSSKYLRVYLEFSFPKETSFQREIKVYHC